VRVRILTRASDLARLQGLYVKRRLEAEPRGLDVSLLTRESSGDRDGETPLWQLTDKGAFTSDLSDALLRDDADLVVHSWKDLPIEPREGTVVAATLSREDPRDLLLVRQPAVERRPAVMTVLSSSPRRALMLQDSLPELLPWPVRSVTCRPVRGNIQTRIRQLMNGAADALIVAKAALDRLLDPESPFVETAGDLRAAIDGCRWAVLPVREFPAAAAQGALAIEAAVSNAPVLDLLSRANHAPTWRAVIAERSLLASYGGGCHQAIGATVQHLPFGDVVSLRGRAESSEVLSRWTLTPRAERQPPAPLASLWPRPDESPPVARSRREVAQPRDDRGFYVTRNEALPADWRVAPERIVWTAGTTTWRKLAARGVWVHGSSEGLGHFHSGAVDRIAGRRVAWHRLTHAGADVEDALVTYESERTLPPDLGSRTHFFWRSASEFRKALAAFPPVRDGWHACGPGHTFDVVQRIAGAARVRPFLRYTDWLAEITR